MLLFTTIYVISHNQTVVDSRGVAERDALEGDAWWPPLLDFRRENKAGNILSSMLLPFLSGELNTGTNLYPFAYTNGDHDLRFAINNRSSTLNSESLANQSDIAKQSLPWATCSFSRLFGPIRARLRARYLFPISGVRQHTFVEPNMFANVHWQNL